MTEQENAKVNRPSEPVSTGDGSQPAGDQDQAAEDQAAEDQAAEDQDQAKAYKDGYADGLAVNDQKLTDQAVPGRAEDKGGNGDLIGRFAETLTEVIKRENQQQSKVLTDLLGISVDQQSDIIEILNNLTEMIKQDRANNEIIKQQTLMVSEVVVESSKILEEIYRKISQ